MTAQTPYILACVNGAPISTAVCDYAVWLAQGTQSPLHFLHNIEQIERPLKADLTGNIGLGSQKHLLDELATLEQQRNKLLLQEGNLILSTLKERAEKSTLKDIHTRQQHGSINETLLDLEENIKTLVLGVRGTHHDNPHKKISSHLELMIRAINRPILVVNDPFTPPKNIMLAYDGSVAAEKALDMIAKSPLYQALNCHIVCVNKSKQAEQLLVSARHTLPSSMSITTALLSGTLENALCHYQEHNAIDLTIMGALNHTRLHDILLGNSIVKMLMKTKKPLLFLR